LRGVIVLCALAVLQSVDGVKCFEGKVTYCGISNDGGAIAPPGLGMFVEGPGWACADDNSGLTPTTIAPNCWDQASCEALQTGNYDDPHNLSHSSPYDYVSEPTWTSRLSGMNATECPPDEPACALQTTLREGTAECSECRTRFRHSVDRAALFWSVWQIEKECVAEGAPKCVPSKCRCTTDEPFYTEVPEGACSNFAKATCRRQAYRCIYSPADYLVTAYEDYDIVLCTVGEGLPQCKHCVACTDPACLQRSINVSALISDPPANLTDAASYACPAECHEAPRTCWNRTCWEGNLCLPTCDKTKYMRRGHDNGREDGAGLGFYAGTDSEGVLVEEVKCCGGEADKARFKDTKHYQGDHCNFANGAPRGVAPHLLAVLVVALVALWGGRA